MTELVAFVFHIAFTYLVPLSLGIGLLVAIFASTLCIHFNYHYFLVHGELLWDMASEQTKKVRKVVELNGLKWEVGIADAFLSISITTLICLLAAIMWPITLLLVVMLLLLHTMKFIFRGRHRKFRFMMNLKSSNNE